jgi:hypothetical protein
MEKYSKIYTESGSTEKLFGYRYNYEDNILEYVSKADYDDDGNEIELPDWEVAEEYGLSLENWKEDPQHWVDKMANWMCEEVSYLTDEFLANEL